MIYNYSINGTIESNTLGQTNSIIKNMNERPTVEKFETFSNGKTSKRDIQVKKNRNGQFTIS